MHAGSQATESWAGPGNKANCKQRPQYIIYAASDQKLDDGKAWERG